MTVRLAAYGREKKKEKEISEELRKKFTSYYNNMHRDPLSLVRAYCIAHQLLVRKNKELFEGLPAFLFTSLLEEYDNSFFKKTYAKYRLVELCKENHERMVWAISVAALELDLITDVEGGMVD